MFARCSVLPGFAVVTVCSAMALLAVAGCSDLPGVEVTNPLEQPVYLWPATADAQFAKGASAATPVTVFTLRSSTWFNTPEEEKAKIAETCGPAYRTARVFRHDQGGSPLHPIELVVYCGDLKPRVAVYPEPGTGLSENLSALTYPLNANDPGELVVLR